MRKRRTTGITRREDLKDGLLVDLVYRGSRMQGVCVSVGTIESERLGYSYVDFVLNAGRYNCPTIKLIHLPPEQVLFVEGAVKIPDALHPEFFEIVREPDINKIGNRRLYENNVARYETFLEYLRQGGLVE